MIVKPGPLLPWPLAVTTTGPVVAPTGTVTPILPALQLVTVSVLAVAHVIEISVWAGFYTLADLTIKGATPFEFAFENYTALGYGDAVAVDGWRLIGPITALNGLLLVGISVAIIFEIMKLVDIQIARRPRRNR